MDLDKINLGKKLYYKEETGSTNNDAFECETAADGCVFVAETQTGGKGSRGRDWNSEKNVGIWMSILLYPKLPASDIAKVTLTAGMAVCTVLRNAGYNALIKWPNDIVTDGKKVCGILTEKRAEKVVVGIGINVNTESFAQELKDKATSLFISGGKKVEREPLINLIYAEFERLYGILKDKGFSELRPKYAELSATLGKKIKVIQPNESYEAKAIGITNNGELLILHDNKEEVLCSGEVSVRGIYGYI